MRDPGEGQPQPRKGRERGDQGQETADTQIPARSHRRDSAPHRIAAFCPRTRCLFTGCVAHKHLGACRDPSPRPNSAPAGASRSNSYESRVGPAHLPGPPGPTRAFRSGCLGPDIRPWPTGPQGAGQGRPKEGLRPKGRGWGPADARPGAAFRKYYRSTASRKPVPPLPVSHVRLSCADGQLPSSPPTTPGTPVTLCAQVLSPSLTHGFKPQRSTDSTLLKPGSRAFLRSALP